MARIRREHPSIGVDIRSHRLRREQQRRRVDRTKDADRLHASERLHRHKRPRREREGHRRALQPRQAVLARGGAPDQGLLRRECQRLDARRDLRSDRGTHSTGRRHALNQLSFLYISLFFQLFFQTLPF